MKKLLLLLAMLLALTACSSKKPVEEEKPDTELGSDQEEDEEEIEEEEKDEEDESSAIRSIYSGRQVSQEEQKARPLMLMVDNHPSARQQASLSKASIIWEMRVEGPYTRYLALFERPDQDEDFLVGPIRSARPNFITIAHQYGGIFGHVGASGDGYKLTGQLGLQHFDAYRGTAPSFFRYTETGKRAPNNMYSKIQDIFAAAPGKGLTMENNGKGFTFNKDDQELEAGKDANNISFVYSSSDASIRYEYDQATKTYLRFREGQQMLDENTEEPIKAKNIIIQYADSHVYDKSGHQRFDSVGSGKGYYISLGKIKEIKWSKTDDHINPTEYTYEDGSELVLNPGQTWIQVIDSKMQVNVE